MPKNKKPRPFLPNLPPVNEESDALPLNQRLRRRQRAFDKLHRINDEHQADGMQIYQLTHEEVRAKNFGEHTLEAMDMLQERDPELGNRAAYLQVQGLNRYQAAGVVNFGLHRDQVEVPHFSVRTMKAMQVLMNRPPTCKEIIQSALVGLLTWASRKEVRTMAAYQQVQGLDAGQLKGLVSGLSRAEVLAVSGTTVNRIVDTQPPVIIEKSSPNVAEIGKFTHLHALKARQAASAAQGSCR